MNWPALLTEVQTDPLGRDYASMTDQQVADSLNAKNRPTYTTIASNELLAWAAGGADDVGGVKARIHRIKAAANKQAPFASVPDSIAGIAAAADVLITRDGTALNLNRTDHMTMVDAMVAAGVLTAAEKTQLTTLATVQVSRVEELGLGGVPTATDINRVRGWF